MRYTFDTRQVCATKVEFDYDGDVVTNVAFIGGCNGNLKAISLLVDGLTPQEIIDKCEGLTCGLRDTSCTDQFTIALKEVLSKEILA